MKFALLRHRLQLRERHPSGIGHLLRLQRKFLRLHIGVNQPDRVVAVDPLKHRDQLGIFPCCSNAQLLHKLPPAGIPCILALYRRAAGSRPYSRQQLQAGISFLNQHLSVGIHRKNCHNQMVFSRAERISSFMQLSRFPKTMVIYIPKLHPCSPFVRIERGENLPCT